MDNIKKYENVNCAKKIILTAKDYSNLFNYTFQIKKYSNRKYVKKLQLKQLNGLYRFQQLWDYVSWLN